MDWTLTQGRIGPSRSTVGTDLDGARREKLNLNIPAAPPSTPARRAYRSGSRSERRGLPRPQSARDYRRKIHPDPAAPDHAAMVVRSLPRARRDPRPALRDSIAAPVVKWVGGKTKLLPELLARMPERFARYYEPFAGGAAVFFRIAPERAVLADSNPDLIGLYTCLARDVTGVIRRLEHHRA